MNRNLRILICCAVLSGIASCGGTSVEGDRLDFYLQDVSGQSVSSEDPRFKGKVIVIDLWGSWCPPCIEMMPHLRHWHEQYAKAGLEIVGINFEALVMDNDKYRKGMAEYVDEHAIPYTVLLGGDSRYPADVLPGIKNFEGFPTTFFIGRDGTVRHVKSGFIPSEVDWYEGTIKALLAETVN